MVEGSFNEVLALFAEAMINGGHRLDDTGGRTCEGELTVFDLTFVQGKGTIAQHDETAVREVAGFIFVEVENDFFVGELVVADFHIYE